MIADASELKKDGGQQAIDANVLVDSTLDVIAHTLHSSRCSFMLLDTDTSELRVGGARGLSAEVIARSRVKFGESIAGVVASSRQPLLIRDIRAHPELRGRGNGGCKTNSLISVPVIVRDEVYGVLNVTDRIDGGAFDEDDMATLNLLASHLSLCVENSMLQVQIQRLANTDGLTGAYNHRYFHERLCEEVERASRFGKSFSLLMIDVNGFKDFNDRYGHPSGDAVLKEIAALLRGGVRHLDLVARYGGDEFTIILPETDTPRAMRVAGRIERAVTTHRFDYESPEGFPGLTISIGISTFPSPASCKQDLIEQADKAMYRAKRGAPPHVQFWQGPAGIGSDALRLVG